MKAMIMKNKIKLLFILNILIFSSSLYAKHKYTYMGENAYAKGNYDYAFTLFQKAIDAGEIRGEPWFFMGSIKDANREYASSIPYFEKAVTRPLKRDYKIAALWKIVLYYKSVHQHEKTIEYAKQLNNIGIYHSSLKKIIENAQKNINPDIARSREYLEKAIEEDKKIKDIDIIDFSKFKSEIEYIINNYHKAIELNPNYFSYSWRIGYYQEKLERWNDAYKTYKEISMKSDSLRVQYKLGVIQKHRKNFIQSLEHLRRVVLESKEDQKRLKYYAHLNLAQAYFANGNNESAKIHSATSIKLSEYKVSQQNKSKIDKITYCLASLNLVIEKKRDKIPSLCKNLTKKNFDNYLTEESSLVDLIEAKIIQIKMLSELNYKKKEKYEEKISNIYNRSLFTRITDGNKISHKNHFTGEFFLNQWAYRELKFPSNLFYKHKNYKSMVLLIESYPMSEKFITLEQKIHAYFHLKNDEKVLSLYQNDLSYAAFQKAMISSGRLKNYSKISTLIQNRIAKSENPEKTKSNIKTFLKNPIFNDYRKSEEYNNIF